MQGLVKVLTKLPFWFLYGIGDFLCFIMARIMKYRRDIILKNLRASFPEKTEKEINKICMAYYHHLCDVFIEIIKFYGMSDDEMKKHVDFVGVEQLMKDAEEGRNCMILTSHHCNWEAPIAIPLYFDGSLGIHSCHVYRNLADKKFDALMVKIRNGFGSNSVEGGKILRYLVGKTKTEKRVFVGFPADQRPTDKILHYWTNFMNQEAAVLDSPERLARMFKMSCYFCHITKIKRGYYQCRYIKICENVAETPEFYVSEQYIRLLEENIKEQPEYYFWSHNRWKGRE